MQKKKKGDGCYEYELDNLKFILFTNSCSGQNMADKHYTPKIS